MVEATKPDLLTIAAIAIVATVIADFIHEALGHGGMGLASGGLPLMLSTVHFECFPDARLVAAGGTIANLLFGMLFWITVRVIERSPSWRYFSWLSMTFNLFEAGGYLLFSGIGNIGDWAIVVAGWQPAWAWRMGLAALGIVTIQVRLRRASKTALPATAFLLRCYQSLHRCQSGRFRWNGFANHPCGRQGSSRLSSGWNIASCRPSRYRFLTRRFYSMEVSWCDRVARSLCSPERAVSSCALAKWLLAIAAC